MTITLMGKQIDLEMVDKLPDNSEDLGLFDPSLDKIYVKKGLSKDITDRIILHEITHALICLSGLRHPLGKAKEEAVCDLMENLVSVVELRS